MRLDQLGFPLCWVAMLSCSTWVMEVLMNINDEHDLPLCYIFACLITRSYELIGTWRTTQKNSTTTRHMALSWLNN
jgi:hypothetical protein